MIDNLFIILILILASDFIVRTLQQRKKIIQNKTRSSETGRIAKN